MIPRIRWPRGRYNGRRIVGAEMKVRVDLTYWRLAWGSVIYHSCWQVGPIAVWIDATYEWPGLVIGLSESVNAGATPSETGVTESAPPSSFSDTPGEGRG